jgi:hypothetical protein
MQRGTGNKIRTKFRKKGGAPFGIPQLPVGGGGMGLMMNKKFHAKAHERMGMGGGDSSNEKTEEVKDDTSAEVKSKPGKAPENKKEE